MTPVFANLGARKTLNDQRTPDAVWRPMVWTAPVRFF